MTEVQPALTPVYRMNRCHTHSRRIVCKNVANTSLNIPAAVHQKQPVTSSDRPVQGEILLIRPCRPGLAWPGLAPSPGRQSYVEHLHMSRWYNSTLQQLEMGKMRRNRFEASELIPMPLPKPNPEQKPNWSTVSTTELIPMSITPATADPYTVQGWLKFLAKITFVYCCRSHFLLFESRQVVSGLGNSLL